MDPRLNPYTPGAGARPVSLVGRDKELQRWSVAMARAERGYAPRPLALYGLRGVGKTVLLSEMAQQAEQSDWWTAQVESGTGKSLRQAFGEALYRPLADVARPSAGARLLRALKTALSFKMSYDATGNLWNFGVDLDGARGGGADSGVLESDLDKLVQDLSEAAREEGTGIALIIDEAQDLDIEELVAVCAVAHKAAQRAWPFLVVLGGLPSLPRDVAEAKSYAERMFEFFSIERLAEDVAREALVGPAQGEGVRWESEALDFVIDQTQGYPFFLQQYGSSAWEAGEGHSVTYAAAAQGAKQALTELDEGFFLSRWERATRVEQEYLRAMAALSRNDVAKETLPKDAVASSAIAHSLDRKVQSLGPTRAGLISKGLIYAPAHGVVAFTVPLMAGFVERQPAS